MEATIRKETETSIHDLGTTAPRGEALAGTGHKTNGEELRTKIQHALERAKVLCQRLQEKTVTTAKAADKTVRAHPYQTIGIAFGVGLLVGLLVMRRRHT